MTTLIIGGTSGLGLLLAEQFRATSRVVITGRKNPQIANLPFVSLDLQSINQVGAQLDRLLGDLPRIDTLVYAAALYQEGHLSEASDADLEHMLAVGLFAPAALLARILRRQEILPGLITISSTSQWVPREREPLYTATKAGLAMLTNSAALDARITKTLLVAPSGMQTPFYRHSTRSTDGMLDPTWVAQQTIEHFAQPYRYRFIRCLRDPIRIEIAETRIE